MKQLFFYNSLIVIALLASCKKIDIQPTEGEPVFSATVELNGTPHEWQAGIAGYHMYSDWEKDAHNVHVFSGRLAPTTSCCVEALAIHIRGAEALPQGSPDIAAALKTGNGYGFLHLQAGDTTTTITTDTIGWQVLFNASGSTFPAGNANFLWDFGDGNIFSSLSATIIHQYDSTFNGLEIPVKLTVSDTVQIYSGSLTRNILLGGGLPGAQPDTCNLSLFLANPVTPEIGVVGLGTPPFQYNWSTGETSTLVTLDSTSTITVTVTDATGCMASASIFTQVSQGTVPPIYFAQFSYSLSPIVKSDTATLVSPADSLAFSKVVIEYTDANGVLYSSALGPQGQDAHFDLLSVTDYDENEAGEKTKKLTVRFNCRLWDADGNPIDLKNGEAVIAVAYP